MKSARRRQISGVVTVEFALVASLLFTVLIGIMEFGRVLYYWNSAAEATRLGARVAAVCDADATVIQRKMISILPILQASNILVTYTPPGCDVTPALARALCTSVTVSIAPNLTVQTVTPLMPLSLAMPPFTTTLPRESLDSQNGTNPVCS